LTCIYKCITIWGGWKMRWDSAKSERLKRERGVSFEDGGQR